MGTGLMENVFEIPHVSQSRAHLKTALVYISCLASPKPVAT